MELTAKILIADENPIQRRALRDELSRKGYRYIEEAQNGEEALEVIRRFHPDVAIVDVWLSKLDGIGVLRSCRSMDFAPEKAPSFIVVSMVSNQNIFMEAMGAGAELCLLKPYDFGSLCEHIGAIVKKRSGAALNAKAEPAAEKTVEEKSIEVGE